jgi:hypothetical protein
MVFKPNKSQRVKETEKKGSKFYKKISNKINNNQSIRRVNKAK